MKDLRINLEKIVDFIVCAVIVALIILMFTGRTGAIVSGTVFLFLVVVSNLPKKSDKTKLDESEEMAEDFFDKELTFRRKVS
ncbi:MAG: hypothetical protein IJZ25_01085 [Lachnospiraceae bacterium]|nr:hypothetical protein [Lachnospiraceae bacterium]